MLTRCVEKGREKCDHYWPYDTQPVYYGDIQVTILNESHFPDWNISEFRMMRGDTVRKIKHFHFTTWPDFGVPEPPQTLVRFVRAYRQHLTPDQTPVVVHCSAGVGRSGTFISLDRLLQVRDSYLICFLLTWPGGVRESNLSLLTSPSTVGGRCPKNSLMLMAARMVLVPPLA